ncbi:catechol 2,3-dioxygenase-like lactoylglutathione lyase family enzyme [Micromonospora jinlongensis]|uniref:Catechol 2,3-dioxygenase-like lactoylglutathione lyase family enzyme n=1 Tax=Micromonospora jinlongensis TaxID=1287877 RepID=A0A7Z0BH85_9ACTN|nr:VOC family protein [Micromonospora jinlongensis]NYH45745.1 catechol 2,3-dioxygenase-like lactoylglutathione lyase family enzyme [Micromonospora jinlongensis]
MATIEQLSLGVSDAERAARFWAAALDYRRRAPRFDGDEWIVLEPQPGAPGMAVAMDLSESPAQDFPRLHLDLDAGERSLDEELDRLLAHGAQRVDWRHYPTDPHPTEPPYVVLADPEGNRFCVSGRREPPTR